MTSLVIFAIELAEDDTNWAVTDIIYPLAFTIVLTAVSIYLLLRHKKRSS